MDAVDLLKRVPLFSDLDGAELQQIANSMKQRTFSAGQEIAVEGQSGVGFFVIEDGTAKVTVHGDEVRTLGPGDYFGEVALITQGARTATVTADTDLKTYGMTFWEFRPAGRGHAAHRLEAPPVGSQDSTPLPRAGSASARGRESRVALSLRPSSTRSFARPRGIAAELVNLDAGRPLEYTPAEEDAFQRLGCLDHRPRAPCP